jgi:hypothetical protein
MTDEAITFTWETSHRKGGQHTNGPDYGVVTAEHAIAGVKVSIQTSRHFRQLQARELSAMLVEMAVKELASGGHP